MTDQTIYPCPVCGNVPKYDSLHGFRMEKCCGKAIGYSKSGWNTRCDQELGSVVRAYGIETVEQLNARLAPDPRVAVLTALMQLRVILMSILDDGAIPNGTDNRVLLARQINKDVAVYLAAQRGEVEG